MLPSLAQQTEQMRLLRRRFPQAAIVGTVYHGTDKPPSLVLEQGLPPTGGDSFDLAVHQRQFERPGQAAEERSAMRGSSLNAYVPAGFAGTGSYVYRLVPVGGGVEVNTALGNKRVNILEGRIEGSLMPGEQEIAIGSQQPACQIEGYHVVGAYHESSGQYRLGPFIPNPRFKPGAWESKVVYPPE